MVAPWIAGFRLACSAPERVQTFARRPSFVGWSTYLLYCQIGRRASLTRRRALCLKAQAWGSHSESVPFRVGATGDSGSAIHASRYFVDTSTFVVVLPLGRVAVYPNRDVLHGCPVLFGFVLKVFPGILLGSLMSLGGALPQQMFQEQRNNQRFQINSKHVYLTQNFRWISTQH
jgi:hypothetical protein